MALFIGIDSGTQSTKAVVVDLETGATIARARSPHTLIAGLPEGHMEQHPEEWVRALETVITEVAGTIDRSQVKGIGVSGQQHGFVPLDRKGAVIRPAKLWCDTSTVEECAWLTKALGGPKGVLRETGVPFLPGYTAPKILWLKRHEPQHFRRLRQVALPHDYLNYHLTGKLRMEYGDASGTALLDVRKRAWSERTAQLIDPDLIDWLPKVRASDQPAGILTPALTRQFGFRPGVVVSAGGGDNMMGAIGTGNVTPGVVTASFGTSGTIYAYSDEPVVDSMGEVAPFCSSTGGWLPLICTMNVTEVTEQVRHLAQLTRAGFESALASVPWSADGPIFLPYLAGERTPNLPNASGAIFGLKPGKLSAPHLARAAVEGVTLGMNYGLRRLKDHGIVPQEIRLTGGGAKSAAWRQIMADVFAVPVVGMEETEGAALGAAIQAAWSVGSNGRSASQLLTLTNALARTAEATRKLPTPDGVTAAAAVAERFDRLHQTLLPLFQ